MAAYENNDYRITGVIYNIEYQKIQGRKDPTKTYEKYLVTLEVGKKKPYTIPNKNGEAKQGYKTFTEFPQFEAFGMDLSDYHKSDLVEIKFYLSGKEYNKQDGSKGIFCKNILTYIKYADLDAGYPNHKGKINVDGHDVDTSSTSSFVPPPKKKDDIFVPPDPDDDEFKDLPF